LNEARHIENVLARTCSYLSTVVVVDDGSTDDTARLAALHGAHVLRHEQPKGKGAALATGLRWLEAQRCSWAVTMDGDGQHSAHDIPRFFACAAQSGAGLVVGNRMSAPGGMPWLRRNVNRWMSRRLSHLAGQNLPDSQCGFRLLRLEVWAALDFQTSHFETESELLLGFIAAGQRVAFVPIEVIYRTEQSKMNPLADSWRWLRWWWQARSACAAGGNPRWGTPARPRVPNGLSAARR
jgi:glycosyltransferase involved in cell wall biosynthesis